MPTFDYQGRNLDGKLVVGKRLSQSADLLGEQLIKEGIYPIRIDIQKPDVNYWDAFKTWISRGHISLDELSLFARQMHALIKTGVTVTAALRQLAANARSGSMANALYSIVERLESGQDLASAMTYYPKIFTPIMLSMVKVGQESGHLDEAFLRLNQYLELEAAGVKRIKTVFRYPAIVFSVVIFAVIAINLFVIPTFAKVFAKSNIPLPFATRMLLAVSNFIYAHWFMTLTIVIGIIGAIYYYLSSPKGQYNWSRFQLKMPIFGSILRRVVMLRFAQSFAITIESGVPLLEGLNLVAHTINNKYAEGEIINMTESIRHGNNLTQSAANSKLFTQLELQMTSVSEETGELSQMLEELAVYYRREVDYDLKKLNDIIEPLLIIILAIIILILAFSVYLPVWDMVKMARS
jgi:MSHA biogenesis protein MshG